MTTIAKQGYLKYGQYLQILGVSVNAAEGEIDKAFAKATADFKLKQEAFNALKNGHPVIILSIGSSGRDVRFNAVVEEIARDGSASNQQVLTSTGVEGHPQNIKYAMASEYRNYVRFNISLL
ncbi:Oidioi.mRNA.OKI2018_I69.chr1.g3791.t1.cds [Oikopleura dioica]|uniref:Oidioi.mRNA.OKI2018_I69.chr1.g3791.t1.cds n=1 Tax=Oikopleura dioica TaxID=34765 RepID=A0ABN7T1S2_OIKDI|nr:Oidioi.mRNA.OKI2018_I69.chr1.g3791.t1.cds [Oikopleura dioica]